MYPRLSDIFRDLFGFDFPIPIYSFGAMMAVAFLVAAWLLRREMDRMHEVGRLSTVRLAVKDPKGRKKTQELPPSSTVGTLTIIAVVAGIIGAKLFHILENLDDFARDPLGQIFSAGGLTFFGGLIFAGFAIGYYLRKKNLNIGAVADAVAPGLLLAYGIGRIGCYLAGDGDWGVCSYLDAKPGWLPVWLWSETFPNSIFDPAPHDGVPFNAAVAENCPPGAAGVYPTMLYEFGMAALLFGVLWLVRKHPFKDGWLFALFLVFSGIERFIIEQIRVNNVFDLFGLAVTQAEVIAVLLIVLGALGLILLSKRRTPTATPPIEAVTPSV